MPSGNQGEVDVQGERALVVDLDGTLVRSDILVESAFAYLATNPFRLLNLFTLLTRGKAALKAGIAAETPIDPTLLPYNVSVLTLIEDARRAGCQVYIASASNERYVSAVAAHIRADGWFASDDVLNLSSDAKAKRLVDAFGDRGFDYVGNDRADLPVWAVSRRCILVHPSASLRRALVSAALQPQIIESPPADVKSWMKLLRVHQWMKNVLVFVPLLTAHKFDLGSLISAAGAFLAFSFTASATYIQNDLVDIEADRKHPSKQHRPLAAGTVPIHAAMMAAVLLLVLAFALALAIGLGFATVLAAYLALTIAYTFSLKRKMLVDVIVLAALYTIRVFGGAAAIGVPVSEWLLGFSMFIFTSLALIKRYIELAARVDAELPNPSNRNYRKTDLDIVAAIAAASGFNAVTVFALYISSEAVQQLYRHPKALWLVCPILMYWLGRILMMAHRRQIDDDPVLFALNDWNSFLAFGLIGAIIFCSI